MLEIRQLYAGYRKKEILHNLSLTCGTGNITTLIGPNGCGKSTLLRSVCGMTEISSGEILADGNPVRSMPDPVRARKIAYLSQGKNIPETTVERLVLHGRFPYLSYPRRYRKTDYEIAEKAMKQLGIFDLSACPMSSLSGGMRQKAYIAMALCQEAEIILLDEPTTYLDISQQFKLAQILRDLANDGKTILTVFHDILLALKLSDRIALMQEGMLLACGTPQEILSAGLLPQVFGVEVGTIENEDGIEYYYRQST